MAEKKVKGRKRHIGLDIEGHLLHVEVTAANKHDTRVGGYTIESMKIKYPTIEAVSADAGYRGDTVDYSEILLDTPVHISTRVKDQFAILPKRWIVERTLLGLIMIVDWQRIMKSISSILKMWFVSQCSSELSNELSKFMKTGSYSHMNGLLHRSAHGNTDLRILVQNRGGIPKRDSWDCLHLHTHHESPLQYLSYANQYRYNTRIFSLLLLYDDCLYFYDCKEFNFSLAVIVSATSCQIIGEINFHNDSGRI
ncbi:MAG: transposase [Candidatus Omnitrophica bacterium]|nr:transposase [Candidatus Omnitrophota bacterium]